MPRGIPAWSKPARKLSNADRSWVAASLDCEGTISFHAGRSNYGVIIRIEMCNADYLRRMASICGGWLSVDRPQKGNRKQHSIWQISSEGGRWLLPQILDRLVIKKRHAELILQYLSFAKRGQKRTPEMEAIAVAIRSEMWTLNKRGQWGRETWSESQHQKAIKKKSG
jgi:hypothetical protein